MPKNEIEVKQQKHYAFKPEHRFENISQLIKKAELHS